MEYVRAGSHPATERSDEPPRPCEQELSVEPVRLLSCLQRHEVLQADGRRSEERYRRYGCRVRGCPCDLGVLTGCRQPSPPYRGFDRYPGILEGEVPEDRQDNHL